MLTVHNNNTRTSEYTCASSQRGCDWVTGCHKEVVMRKTSFAFVFWFKYVYVQVFGVVRGLHWVNRNIQFAKLSGQKSLRRVENSFHWKCNRGLNLTAWEGT